MDSSDFFVCKMQNILLPIKYHMAQLEKCSINGHYLFSENLESEFDCFDENKKGLFFHEYLHIPFVRIYLIRIAIYHVSPMSCIKGD